MGGPGPLHWWGGRHVAGGAFMGPCSPQASQSCSSYRCSIPRGGSCWMTGGHFPFKGLLSTQALPRSPLLLSFHLESPTCHQSREEDAVDLLLLWTQMLIFVRLSGQWSRTCLKCRRPRFDPWVGKILWRREWQPTPVFCLENSMDRGLQFGRLQFMGLQRVRHDWAANTFLFWWSEGSHIQSPDMKVSAGAFTGLSHFWDNLPEVGFSTDLPSFS